MLKLVLLRHGQSAWNLENRFTGWVDVDLSEQGIEEAHRAGKLLKAEGFYFDLAFTSILKRAIRTLWITLGNLDQMWIPVKKSWRLNERHYGGLQGLNKSETVETHGKEQVLIWRRSYDISPPIMNEKDYSAFADEARCAKIPKRNLPRTESLKDTVARFMPYWSETIVPKLREGRKVLICAHGNSLRALVKHLDNINDQDIAELNIPTGIPLVYELDASLKSIGHYYLGDPDEAKKAAESVARQTESKS
tara:strand:+ start:1833 stop:2582 length:750 start_codon:yes stop_codon:yes gene_type:complete